MNTGGSGTQRWRLFGFVLFVSLICTAGLDRRSVWADTVSVRLRAGQYEISKNSDGADMILIEGFGLNDDPGNPEIPRGVFNILLPPSVDLTTVGLRIVDQRTRDLEQRFEIGPAPPAVTWVDGEQLVDWGKDKEIVDGCNAKVYELDAGYPENHARLVATSQMRKYKFARVEYSPFRYNPVSGVLTFADEVTLEIDYEASSVIAPTLMMDSVADDAASSMFLNPEDRHTWYGKTTGLLSTSDYVIITTNAIVSGSQRLSDFVTHKESRGHSVLIVTEDDYGSLVGQAPNNRAEKIRQWLIDNYAVLGIEYVLLIGDPHPYESGEGDIPMKMCWPRYTEETYRESPTDYFYADLTGNWDLDSDQNFGEWGDDTGSGGVDYSPEVFVGRIALYDSDFTTLDSILEKVMDYENEPEEFIGWRNNVLLPESFFDSGTDYAALAEQVKDDYLDPLGYSCWRMYQQGGGACAVNSAYTSEEELRGGTVVRDRWAADNFGVVLWAGHGGSTSASVGYSGCSDGLLFYYTYCSWLDDDYPAFTYQGSCNNGWPENANNLGYSLLFEGAIATVSASRVSWYSWGQSYGDFDGSMTIGGIGYEYVLRLLQEMDCGHALYLAKASMTPSHGCWLMNYYDFNLYGDPSVSLISVGPPAWAGVTSAPLGDTGNGRSVAWGDYDNDGDMDLYLTNYGENKLLRNDEGIFSDVTSGPLGDAGDSWTAAWGDYDNDGDLDLYIADYEETVPGSINRLLRNDGGVFTDVTSGPLGDTGYGRAVGWGDYDNDGDLDIYLVNNGPNKLLRNDGGDVFVDATSGPLGDSGNGLGGAWADYDNDGDLDLYVSNYGGSNRLLRNDDGVFADATSGPIGDTMNGFGLAWGDYDNDGDLDLYLANANMPNKLFRNEGGDVFSDVTSGPLGDAGNGSGVAWGDYDNDGDLDLYLSNGGTSNKLFRNQGGGEFVDVTGGELADVNHGMGVAWCDYDDDGDLDLYVVNVGAANKLLVNEVVNDNHWLQVDLVGTISNAVGIGARVRVVSGGLTQVREISGGSGFCCQNSLTAEFGLGPVSTVDTLEVRWPSGVKTYDYALAADQKVIIYEPATCLDIDGDGYGQMPHPLCTYEGIDCDDADSTAYPGATEVCDGVDNDCDTEIDEGLCDDYDSDGYGVFCTSTCIHEGIDCNDSDSTAYPGAPEVCDSVDNNCDGNIDEGDYAWLATTSGPLGDSGPGFGAAWGDCDGDGDADLYVANYNGANVLLINDDSVFVDSTSGPLGDAGKGTGTAWADYDNDGDLDLYLSNYGTSNKLFRNDGGGTFVDATDGPVGDTGYGRAVAWLDHDNDGDLDLYLVLNGANKLLDNDGAGTFSDVTTGPLGDTGNGWGLACGDYDSDGDQDIYVANAGSSNKLFRNDGMGVFVDVTSGPLGDTGNGMGVAWGDYDNDGDLDLYLAKSGASNRLFRNDGSGEFTDVTNGPLGDTSIGRGVVWGDYDNDGDLDLYLATAEYSENKLLMNTGGDTFEDVTGDILDDTGQGYGVAVADYDHDGRVDIYLANYDDPNILFHNDYQYVCALWHWLEVRLVGTMSNASAIGAHVRISAGGVSQIREVSGGSGLCSQNSLTLHFGLSSAAIVDTLEVRWPSGIVQHAFDLAADQVVTVVETDLAGTANPAVSPGHYKLYPNYPNPFDGVTAIRYDLPQSDCVSLRVYDSLGRKIRELVHVSNLSPGRYTVYWDGRNDRGRSVSPGVYFCRLETGEYSKTHRMVVLR